MAIAFFVEDTIFIRYKQVELKLCVLEMTLILIMVYLQQFEDNIRKNRSVMINWIKYAAWEESQKEIQRWVPLCDLKHE